MVISAQHGVLVVLGRASLGGADEARAHPHRTGAQGQRHGQAATVVDAARGHHQHRAAREARLAALAQVHNLGDEHRSGHVARVSAALAALRANCAELEKTDGEDESQLMSQPCNWQQVSQQSSSSPSSSSEPNQVRI